MNQEQMSRGTMLTLQQTHVMACPISEAVFETVHVQNALTYQLMQQAVYKTVSTCRERVWRIRPPPINPTNCLQTVSMCRERACWHLDLSIDPTELSPQNCLHVRGW
jgi:hypothetical protein